MASQSRGVACGGGRTSLVPNPGAGRGGDGTIARVGLAHGAGKVAGEPDAIRALLVVIASSDGFAQAQRTPSRKSLRNFSPPSPMAALQL